MLKLVRPSIVHSGRSSRGRVSGIELARMAKTVTTTVTTARLRRPRGGSAWRGRDQLSDHRASPRSMMSGPSPATTASSRGPAPASEPARAVVPRALARNVDDDRLIVTRRLHRRRPPPGVMLRQESLEWDAGLRRGAGGGPGATGGLAGGRG